MANWADLPKDLLASIARRLSDIEDFIRFRWVCCAWRSVAMKEKYLQLPCLVLSGKKESTDTLCLFSLPKGKRYEFKLPNASKCRFFGSVHGWLLVNGVKTEEVHLLNPLTGVRIRLPNIIDKDFNTKERGYWIKKATLFKTPPGCSDNEEDIVVTMIFYKTNARRWPPDGSAIIEWISIDAFGRTKSLVPTGPPGDKVWTSIEAPRKRWYEDIRYFKGQLYALTRTGELDLCDTTKNVEFAPEPVQKQGSSFVEPVAEKYSRYDSILVRRYLVESLGELLMVMHFRAYNPFCQKISKFEVYRMDFGTRRWVEIEGLSDRILLMGDDYCVSLWPSDLPSANFRGNCIYIIDKHQKRDTNNEISIYDMANGKLQSRKDPQSVLLNSITWLMPDL
ncbi:PREDICTED: F-box protein At2g26160-like [Nelumbo nucifera]|uniref:F-box protein At2g26160-like n=1 Tax=Nelumbo nucifera TaxID=4432 RepID=A0A1U7ZSM0_NELNU|nr:PREDICTED: F-box protein At2g26160-like [Nelumbo nucifera]